MQLSSSNKISLHSSSFVSVLCHYNMHLHNWLARTYFLQEPLQAAAARALVQYVYQRVLPDSSQQQALLVHMLHLAHRFAVQSCRAACLSALMAVPQEQLQLDAIHVVFSLLSEQQDSPGFPQLLQHCLDHLQQLLGNLEATLSDQALLSRLQQLPHPGTAPTPPTPYAADSLCTLSAEA